jgi:RHS repeat-associated protein
LVHLYTAKIITRNGEIIAKEYYLRSSTGTDLATLDMTKNKLTWYVHGAGSRIAHFEHTEKLPEAWISPARKSSTADTTKPQTAFGPTLPTALRPVFYNYDHLGNTRLTYTATVKLGDEPGKETYTYTAETLYDYDPYGKILRSFTKSIEKYLTTGHERDTETDLDYRGARFYDSDVVRFLSLDPLAAKYAAWSAYNYVLGNPVRFIDPTGESVDDIIIEGKEDYAKEVFNDIQKMSNNKLALIKVDNGYQVVENSKDVKDAVQVGVAEVLTKPIGTKLINDLIAETQTTYIQKGDTNSAEAVDGNKSILVPQNRENNDGSMMQSNAKVTYNSGDNQGRPARIGLGHELFHARNITGGRDDMTKVWVWFKSAINSSVGNAEEIKAYSFENKLRAENQVIPRTGLPKSDMKVVPGSYFNNGTPGTYIPFKNRKTKEQ